MDSVEKSLRETVKECTRSTNKVILILQVITVAFAGAVATAGLLNYFNR